MQWLVTAPPGRFVPARTPLTTQATLTHENQALRTYQLELQARQQPGGAITGKRRTAVLSLRSQHGGNTPPADPPGQP